LRSAEEGLERLGIRLEMPRVLRVAFFLGVQIGPAGGVEERLERLLPLARRLEPEEELAQRVEPPSSLVRRVRYLELAIVGQVDHGGDVRLPESLIAYQGLPHSPPRIADLTGQILP